MNPYRNKDFKIESFSDTDQILEACRHVLITQGFQIEMVKHVLSDTILYCNQAAADLVGAPDARSLWNRPASEFYPNHEDFNRDDLEVINRGVEKTFLEHVETESGYATLLRTNKVPVKLFSDAFDSVVIVAYNITQAMELAADTYDVGRSRSLQLMKANRRRLNSELGKLLLQFGHAIDD